MSSVMELKGLRKRYEEKGDWILKGIDLRIEKQDFIAIMGRSGCGKRISAGRGRRSRSPG